MEQARHPSNSLASRSRVLEVVDREQAVGVCAATMHAREPGQSIERGCERLVDTFLARWETDD